jgi:hypothetical protein
MNDDIAGIWWKALLIFLVAFFGLCAWGYWLKVL